MHDQLAEAAARVVEPKRRKVRGPGAVGERSSAPRNTAHALSWAGVRWLF